MSESSWQAILPGNKFELWIIRIFIVIMVFGCGFGAGALYKDQAFQHGMDYAWKTAQFLHNQPK